MTADDDLLNLPDMTPAQARAFVRQLHPQGLTVSQLIDALQPLPSDALVLLEDSSAAASVEYDPRDHTVEIRQSPED